MGELFQPLRFYVDVYLHCGHCDLMQGYPLLDILALCHIDIKSYDKIDEIYHRRVSHLML